MDLGKLNGLMQLDAMLRSDDYASIGAAEARLRRLAADLERCDRAAVLRIVAGLMTKVDLHAKSFRLEMLAHLAALRCRGRAVPSGTQLRQWLNDHLAPDAVGRAEDPVEDVFVANVVSGAGNFRLFEGTLEANAGYVQSCLHALTSLVYDGATWAEDALRQATALLALSDAVAERAEATRNELSSGPPRGPVQASAKVVADLAGNVSFSLDDLFKLGVDPEDLVPFDFASVRSASLRGESVGWSSLERRPLVFDRDEVIVALPAAIGAAVRRLAIEAALDAGAAEAFELALTEHQFERVVRYGLRGWGVTLEDVTTYDPATGMGEVVGSFDDGGYVHLVFAQDRLADVAREGFQSVRDVLRPVSELAGAAAARLAARPGYRRGLTLVLFGGVGRGFSAGAGKLPDNWRFAGLGYEDFALLGWDGGFSTLRVHRLLERVRALEARGVRIVNPNGFVNLYAYADGQDFALVPPDVPLGNSTVVIGTDHVGVLRPRLRRALDQHVAAAAGADVFIEVQRQSAGRLFDGGRDEPLYVSVGHALAGRLLACVETAERPWWVEVPDQRPDQGETMVYRVWDLARNWLVRLAPVLEAELPDLPAGPIGIDLRFPDVDTTALETMLVETEPARPTVSVRAGRIEVACPVAYLRAFGLPDNRGDRWMVEAMVEGAAALAGSVFDASRITGLRARVLPEGRARYVHVFPVARAHEAVLSSLPLPRMRLLQPDALAWAALGVAAEAGHRGGPGELTGKTAVDLASAVVGALWSTTRALLERLDRASVVERCLTNHDAVVQDRLTWRNTAAAVLELNGDRADVVRTAIERESERSRAGLASRVVVEMAVCTCPTEGSLPCSAADLDDLLATVATLVEVAGHQDAMFHGVVEKRIVVHPNGAIEFPEAFLLDVQQPYMVAQGGRQFETAAAGYGDLFARVAPDGEDGSMDAGEMDAGERVPKAGSKPSSGASGGDSGADEAFEAAFEEEYALRPAAVAEAISRVAHVALERRTPVVHLPLSELVGLVVEGAGSSREAAAAFVDSMSLRPRARWDEDDPKGASKKDWYPWRFSRRLALVARPVVVLDQSDDPPCLVSVALLDHGLDYALRARDARLPDKFFRTAAMRSWIGRAVHEIGHRFNQRVRDRVEELGFQAVAECKMNRLGGRDADGDVDVLAWNQASGRVFVMECKRLMLDRSVGEVAERIREYAPDNVGAGGKRGPTRKHLDRFAIIQRDLRPLAAITGIAPERMTLLSCLITGQLVPMQFQKASFAHFDVVADIGSLTTALAVRQEA